MNKVLIVGVHLDDETLGCGGSILRYKKEGDEVNWLLISQSTNVLPGNSTEERVQKTEKLVKVIQEQYEFDNVFQLRCAPAQLHEYNVGSLIQKLDSVISQIKPNIIYLPFRGDVHSDHRIVFDAIYGCTKSFRKPYIEKIYMIETLSETEFSPSIPSTSFCPNVYVDITDYIDKKLEIMKLYDTEIMEEPYPRSLSSMKALARVRGSRAGVMYAEAFQLLYERR